MSEMFKEEDFYKDDGRPSEEFCYCSYKFYLSDDSDDYDQFALAVNALYPYMRLSKKRGRSKLPCGFDTSPSTDGWFASVSDEERDEMCPKIAWGFAALFISELRYDNQQKDYVALKDREKLISCYYNKYLQIYLLGHNGLKYQNTTEEQKELAFLEEHESVIKALWEKSDPLKKYPELYQYAAGAEADYERFIENRREEIKKKMEGDENPVAKGGRSITQNGEKTVYIENNVGNIIIESVGKCR